MKPVRSRLLTRTTALRCIRCCAVRVVSTKRYRDEVVHPPCARCGAPEVVISKRREKK